jgi:hypothetical protein
MALEVAPPHIPKHNGGKSLEAGNQDISNFDSELTKGGKISIGGKGATSEELVGFGHEFEGFDYVDTSMLDAFP